MKMKTETAPRIMASVSFKLFVVMWTMLENVLFSGLRAGWPALVYVLKKERIYQDLCVNESISRNSDNLTLVDGFDGVIYKSLIETNPIVNYSSHDTRLSRSLSNSTLDCGSQDIAFNQCFTIASALMALSSLLYGHLNFRFGIRTPRMLSVLIFCSGSLCMAFINTDLPWLIYPGLILISAGGNALFITNSQVSYYFTTGAVAVIGLECGALEASSFMQSVIKILYEHGISLRYAYLVLGCSYFITLISTFFLLPKQFVMEENEREQTITSGASNGPQESATVNMLDKTFNHSQYDIAEEASQCEFKNNHGELQVHSSVDEEVSEPQTVHDELKDGDLMKHQQKLSDFNHHFDSNVRMSDSEEKIVQYDSIDKNINQLGLAEKNNDQSDFRDKTETCHVVSGNEDDVESDSDKSKENKQMDVMSFNNEKKYDKADEEIILFCGEGSEIESQFVGSPKLPDFNNSLEISFVPNKHLQSSEVEVDQHGLWKSLMSKTFLLYLFWASSVQLVLSIALGTFNPWLEYVLDGDLGKVSLYTDVLLYSMLASPVLSLGVGLAIDSLQLWRKDTKSAGARTLFSAAMSLGVASCLSILLCVLIMLCDSQTIFLTSVMVVLFRICLYSCGTGFLRIMYPTHHFGILCGVMSVVAGGLSFIQYPLFIWVQKGHNAWSEVFGSISIVAIVSLSHPVYLLWISTKQSNFYKVEK